MCCSCTNLYLQLQPSSPFLGAASDVPKMAETLFQGGASVHNAVYIDRNKIPNCEGSCHVARTPLLWKWQGQRKTASAHRQKTCMCMCLGSIFAASVAMWKCCNFLEPTGSIVLPALAACNTHSVKSVLMERERINGESVNLAMATRMLLVAARNCLKTFPTYCWIFFVSPAFLIRQDI